MDEHVEWVQDSGGSPPSAHHSVPRWLIFSYVATTILAFVLLLLYWNGSFGYLDRGYWKELQEVANTRYPFENHNSPKEE